MWTQLACVSVNIKEGKGITWSLKTTELPKIVDIKRRALAPTERFAVFCLTTVRALIGVEVYEAYLYIVKVVPLFTGVTFNYWSETDVDS